MADPLRLYGPATCGPDGYPERWHRGDPPIKLLIRQQEEHRCERCRHPYPLGIAGLHPRGEWTPCDEECTHAGPVRAREAGLGDEALWLIRHPAGVPVGETLTDVGPDGREVVRWEVEAQWRILTVHHLNGVKWDCRWWNLAALCQRCHLTIQGKVKMERDYPHEHSDWFKPHAAGYYASVYLGEDLSREETLERLGELLLLGPANAGQRSLLWP